MTWTLLRNFTSWSERFLVKKLQNNIPGSFINALQRRDTDAKTNTNHVTKIVNQILIMLTLHVCNIGHQLLQHSPIITNSIKEQVTCHLLTPGIYCKPSPYSLIYVFKNGLLIVIFSCTHLCSHLKVMIHNLIGIIILLK